MTMRRLFSISSRMMTTQRAGILGTLRVPEKLSSLNMTRNGSRSMGFHYVNRTVTTSANIPSYFEKYPHPLFFHQNGQKQEIRMVDSEKAICVGYFENFNASVPSSSIDAFKVNKEFEDSLHDFIRSNLEKDQQLVALAKHQKNGWLHIHDHRVFTAYGRVPDPEDIFGSVLLSDGYIVPNTYQRMPTHRILSTNGLFQLSDALYPLYIQCLLSNKSMVE